MSHPDFHLETAKLSGSDAWPVPPLVQRWMNSRGFTTFSQFSEFTDFRLKDLKDPFSLKDMERAVERLVRAFKEEQCIGIYGDYDMDGTPGIALLAQGFESLGFKKIVMFQPDRFSDGYGVHKHWLQQMIEKDGVEVFVSVDVGITDVEAIAYSQSVGVDFIVTDHHQPKADLPPAYAIVNPNQDSCSSGLEYLCGTGVAFYLILALRRRMVELGLLVKDFDPKVLLDLFAIATLTDMVPVIKENRALVQHGLLQLSKTRRAGLRGLMTALNLSEKKLTSSDVAIQLSPKLNALGRMDFRIRALDILREKDEQNAIALVEETLAAQKKRSEIQRAGETLLLEMIQMSGQQGFVLQASEHFYKGVVGLLATRALQNHGWPSFVGSILEDKIVGSARAPSGQSLLDAFAYAEDLLTHFGGHHQAAGFELPLVNWSHFTERLTSYYQSLPPSPPLELTFDCEASLGELDAEFKKWLQRLEPYGKSFELPIFRLDHLFVAQTRVLKEKHLKLTLKDIYGNKMDALWFFVEDIENKKNLVSRRISILAEPSVNFYNGKESLQLLIKDLKLEYS